MPSNAGATGGKGGEVYPVCPVKSPYKTELYLTPAAFLYTLAPAQKMPEYDVADAVPVLFSC